MSPATNGLLASSAVKATAQHAALSEYLASADTTTSSSVLDAALEKFAEPIETAATTSKDEELEEALTLAWKAVIAHAADTPFTDPGADKLVEFVLELSARPDVEKSEGGDAPVKVQDMTLWQDLPTFGWQMRDAWNFGKCMADDMVQSH